MYAPGTALAAVDVDELFNHVYTGPRRTPDMPASGFWGEQVGWGLIEEKTFPDKRRNAFYTVGYDIHSRDE